MMVCIDYGAKVRDELRRMTPYIIESAKKDLISRLNRSVTRSRHKRLPHTC